jgi:site-specific DNA-methyltransferase (adenine-specific)
MNKDINIGDCQLMFGDCLERMKEIGDKSIDMILCDLPYGVLNKSNPSAKWDSIIPFEPLWEQYKRITKPNAAIVLFSQGMFTANLMMSNPKWWRYNLIWDKVLKNGFLNANRQPLRQHEDICVFSSGQTIYNPQMVKCEPRQKNHRRHRSGEDKLNGELTNRCYGKFGDVPDMITDEKYPTSIISVPKQHINGKSYHPTEKPVALLEYLIKTYSNENDVVLDNTCGSGSCGVASVNTNRRFIGIEKDDNYFEIAQKRIGEAIKQKQQTLFNGTD